LPANFIQEKLMRSDYLPDDLKKLWQELDAHPVQVPAEELRRESRKLRGGVRFRNWFVVVVCAVIVSAYSLYFFVFKGALERIGSVLAIAGAINAIVQFLKRPARILPESGMECASFYRAELERQRDFHRGKGVFSWLLPVLPGPVVWAIGFGLARPQILPVIKLEMAGFLVIAAIVVPLNLRMARRLQRRIDALDRSQLEESSL
jgi:hypothetical protein